LKLRHFRGVRFAVWRDSLAGRPHSHLDCRAAHTRPAAVLDDEFDTGGSSAALSFAIAGFLATYRAWLTTFAPILISFSLRVVIDQSLIGSGVAGEHRKALGL